MTIDSLVFDARSGITVVSFLTFLGIIWWTYIKHRSSDFDEAARLPFAEDADAMETTEAEKHHG